jgi:hypothetical protein
MSRTDAAEIPGSPHGAFKQTPSELPEPVETQANSGGEPPKAQKAESKTNPTANLPLFTGEAGSMAVSEWLKRWENHRTVQCWSPEDEAKKLLSFTTGKAFLALSKLPGTCTAEIQKSTLRKVFGITPEKAFARLTAKKFVVGEDDTDIVGTSITELVDICFGASQITKDRLALMFFWNSLPTNQETRNLQMLHAMNKTPTLESALDICRSSFLNDSTEEHSFAISNANEFQTWNRRGKGKGKGKGSRGKTRSWSYPTRPIQKGQYTGHHKDKCSRCGGLGHRSNVCPSQDLEQVCSESNSFIILSYLVKGKQRKFLIDTGSSVTIVSNDELVENFHVDDSHTVRINTLAGPRNLKTARNVELMRVKLTQVLLSDKLIDIGGTQCAGILGMDWLREAGPFHVSFEEHAPRISFRQLPGAIFVGAQGLIIESDAELNNDVTSEKTVLIEKEDFILRRNPADDGKWRWSVSWKWIDGKLPPRKIFPAHYGMNTLNEEETALVTKELAEWRENYLEPIEWSEVCSAAPIVPVKQLHKTTPVRMVHDLTWLNSHVVTLPNSDRPPIGAPEYIRKWRAQPNASIYLVDIRKAYLNIVVDRECAKWQCMRLPGDDQPYILNRLGFGLTISPKVLRTVLETILPSDVLIDKFVDDIYVPEHLLEHVREVLSKNNFPTKEPERLTDARVLGLKNTAGRWGRKDALPTEIEQMTKRGISSYTGKILGIYPVARWLRPACAYVKRKCEEDWDVPVDDRLRHICEQFVSDVNRRGNVIGGEWYYNPHDQWTIWTDASDIARGCVLQIGNVWVEDASHLRKKGDKKHINVAELQAVQDGIELATDYIKALHLRHEVVLRVMCDNATAISWLKQSRQRKWKAIKGLSAKLVERVLIQIAELCKMYNLKLDVVYTPSEANLADELSRVPQYMIEQVDFDASGIEEVVMATSVLDPLPIESPPQERDKFGRLIVAEAELAKLMQAIHEHEGAKALYDRCRLIIYHPRLRQKCLEYVRDCSICQLAKHNTELAPVLKNDRHVRLEAERPFQCMHMDILGPFNEEDGYDRMFVVTMICRMTRFAMTLPTFGCPKAEDAAKIFGFVYARFHTTPDTVVVDEGCQFQRLFSTLIEQYKTRIVSTAVTASFSNGRIERLHRVINERIRANELMGKDISNMNQFVAVVERATMLHNTQLHSVTGSTPHEMVYTFQSWIYPALKNYRVIEKLDYKPINPPEALEEPTNEDEEEHPQASGRLPLEDEVWLWKNPRRRKRDPPFVACRILTRISTQVYRIRMRSGRTRQVHLRHLKPLSRNAAACIPDDLKVPEDPRPLRDLRPSRRRGGGM